ncbi:hypothetical protein KMW28_16035 [Flammeovirga yaeyamensis]|uniref:Nucleotide-diphospho-sugar transferase domain-containing protein n=1 Tax=Flammeovirga yaeyamensis TaxID=367791 RepID=A0AAX1N104_9BACT|nr:hypothetical protein [Flammeovirga yaeyamensis]MBB3698481.1 uncharacterized protein YbcV (DUF1398 family) [Flammeovirga yaeyamensis]NMF34170.1 hypothetical protein [Flammeovirga yaeyamensis]QWG01155.1 hypothetical protein KMW28_16035 [Flammeovirga yaeyamensis]
MSKNILIYQAYGLKEILYECIYSIYTLHTFKSDVDQIVIYTDQKEVFSSLLPERLNINYCSIDQDTIQKWKGEFNFVHRVKIKVIQDTIHKYGNENINYLYLDTDTTFITSPDVLFTSIQNGHLIMHQNEGEITKASKNLVFKKLKKHLDTNYEHQKFNNEMWNAGVLGWNSRYNDLIEKVLTMTDDMYPSYQKHIVEQFAFTTIFNQSAKVESAEDSIYHYWNFKEFRQVLAEFFEKNTNEEDITNKIKNIDPQVLSIPKRNYEDMPFIKKNLYKLKGKWKMPDYEI